MSQSYAVADTDDEPSLHGLICAALDGFDFGATGSAKVENHGLYARREENADWQFLPSAGPIPPSEVAAARATIAEWCATRAHRIDVPAARGAAS